MITSPANYDGNGAIGVSQALLLVNIKLLKLLERSLKLVEEMEETKANLMEFNLILVELLYARRVTIIEPAISDLKCKNRQLKIVVFSLLLTLLGQVILLIRFMYFSESCQPLLFNACK